MARHAQISLRGKDEFIAALKNYNKNVEEGLSEALIKVGRNATHRIKSNLKESLQISKPGESPNVKFSRQERNKKNKRSEKTGRKENYTEVELRKDAIRYILQKPLLGKPLSLRISVRFPHGNAYYAHMLEYGTSKMAARPFYHKEVDEAENEIQAEAQKVMDRAVDKFKK